MNIIYKYRAYTYETKQFTEMIEFRSPEALLALVQLRFDALADVDRENAAPDFKTLVDAINNSFSPTAIKQSKKQFAVYPYKFKSEQHIYFIDIVLHSDLKHIKTLLKPVETGVC